MIKKFETRRFEMVVTELIRGERIQSEDYKTHFENRLYQMVSDLISPKVNIYIYKPDTILNEVEVWVDGLYILFKIDDNKLSVKVEG